jgi:hypothetical protein
MRREDVRMTMRMGILFRVYNTRFESPHCSSVTPNLDRGCGRNSPIIHILHFWDFVYD